MKVVVIGAGIFGIMIALKLAERFNVTLVDMNNDIMQNASRANHNRLHFGYHYPRSKETAIQSLDGYKLFYDYFKDEITNDDFENYYLIEKNGMVNGEEYIAFCDDLNLYYKKQFPKIEMNFDNIEESFLTREPIFDYDLIKNKLVNQINCSKIKLILNKKIDNKKDLKEYDIIVNTTYFNMNRINRLYNLEETALKLQTVVIPFFKYSANRIGVTIMDGDFCSFVPKGFNEGSFLLYHVKESVIYSRCGVEIPKMWYYGKELIKNPFMKKKIYDELIVTKHIKKIKNESKKYFTFLDNCNFGGYWQSVRALPINENDERLSICKTYEVEDKKVISILSGKINTCLLMANNINELL